MATIFIILGAVVLILILRVVKYNSNGEFEYREYVENAEAHYKKTPSEYRGNLNIQTKEEWLKMKQLHIERAKLTEEIQNEILKAELRGEVYPVDEVMRRHEELNDRYS